MKVQPKLLILVTLINLGLVVWTQANLARRVEVEAMPFQYLELYGEYTARVAYDPAQLTEGQGWLQTNSGPEAPAGFYQWRNGVWVYDPDYALGDNAFLSPRGLELTEYPSTLFGDAVLWFDPDGNPKGRMAGSTTGDIYVQVGNRENFIIFGTVEGGNPHNNNDAIGAYQISMYTGDGSPPVIEFYQTTDYDLPNTFLGALGYYGTFGNLFIQNNIAGGDVVLEYRGNALGSEVRVFNDQLNKNVLLISHDGGVGLADGITAPGAQSGFGFLYIDAADGDLKIRFGDGTTKTIATDT